MLKKEAYWLKDKIYSLESDNVFPLLNIGSSTKEERKLYAPWLDEILFEAALNSGKKIIHLDKKNAPDVNVSIDIADPQFVNVIKPLGIRSILCANLLEHVLDRDAICENLLRAIPSGGYLFITCPYKYPYHEDPIDTMFRPEVSELRGLFKGTELIKGEIVDCENYYEYINRDFRKLLWEIYIFIRKFFNRSYRLMLFGLFTYLNKSFEVTCVMLRKK